MRLNDTITCALREDIGRGDVTTRLLFPGPVRIKAAITAKEDGVVCGVGVAGKVFEVAGKKIREDKGKKGRIGVTGYGVRVTKKVKDGEKIKKGEIICTIEGDARAILTGERTALNFLSRLSGVATLTRKYVEKVKPYKTKILDTRKTTPGLRELEKYAVKCGGGVNHRMGLWDGVLVKDNHIASVKCQVSGVRKKIDLGVIVEKIRKRINKGKKGNIRGKKGVGVKIEIEVENLRQFKQVLLARPDIIMLDNMKISYIKKAVKMRNLLPITNYRLPITKLEVSGGVTLENVRAIAKTGADMISIGALTHSAGAIDFSLEVTG